MERCDNCGAEVEKCGQMSDGRKICCAHCVFHPLGCRCKYGEFNVAESYQDPEYPEFDVDDDYDDGWDDEDEDGCWERDEPLCPVCHDLGGDPMNDRATRCPMCGAF